MTKPNRLLCTALAGAALGLAAATASAPAFAADPAPAGCVRGRDLLTSQEREAHRAKLAAAATPEEQQKLRAANQAELKKRAAAKKLPLCPKGDAAQ